MHWAINGLRRENRPPADNVCVCRGGHKNREITLTRQDHSYLRIGQRMYHSIGSEFNNFERIIEKF